MIKSNTEERELSNAEVDQVSGGLNPQPLPPVFPPEKDAPRYDTLRG